MQCLLCSRLASYSSPYVRCECVSDCWRHNISLQASHCSTNHRIPSSRQQRVRFTRNLIKIVVLHFTVVKFCSCYWFHISLKDIVLVSHHTNNFFFSLSLSRTPSFSSITNSNCVDLPACFFLKMNCLMPFSLSYIKKMGSTTGMSTVLFKTPCVELLEKLLGIIILKCLSVYHNIFFFINIAFIAFLFKIVLM